MTHAMAVTLVRLVVTKRRLLEWETAAASAARSSEGEHQRRAFLVGMIASPAVALAGLALVLVLRPSALLVALPLLALWAVAPLVAHRLSQPIPRERLELEPEDRDFLLGVARRTWTYFEAFMGAEDHGLPADNFQETPTPRTAHRTSPTNIGMGLLSTLAAHDLGFLGTAELVERVDTTLTTTEGLERLEGHLFNWYDTVSLAPLPPRYVSTVDSGNLAGSLIALGEGLRQLATAAPPPPEAARLESLAQRALALANGMNFRFLLDPQRHLFSIGYRAADASGPGKLDPSHYDLLASEARLASFLAIAKGDVAQDHWFHLGRAATAVHGAPALLSWSATLFEYLMPLLLMKGYPGTLLDQSCRLAVRRQRDYGRERGVPWGISECAYDVVDRHDNYQYKAFGVPGLGLKRGLGDELVVAPYATALAVLVDPPAAASNLRRLAADGLYGDYGYFDAIDYTPRGEKHAGAKLVRAGRRRPRVPRAPPGHDAGGHRQRAAGRPHGGALPRRPAGAGDRAVAAGARARATRWSPGRAPTTTCTSSRRCRR